MTPPVTASTLIDRQDSKSTTPPGISISRHYTIGNKDPYEGIEWTKRRAEIKGKNGDIVFSMDDVEAPSTWSQNAVDIAADKYFRKAGVPTTGHETSVRQMVTRVAKSIALAGMNQGYFASVADSRAFEDELAYMLVRQVGAFNSPVWFNAGLHTIYGISGKPSGNFCWDEKTGTVVESTSSYERPALSACFILSIKDDLMDIAKHVEREMRVFRFGGGAGGNFSALRGEGEKLSNGGTSSGVMSFLRIYDTSAGSIKSGGTTRRAAKLVCLDVDHPDIEKFIDWKCREEDKALALIKAGYTSDFNGEVYQTISGQNANNSVRLTDEFMNAVINDLSWETRWRTNGKVAKTLSAKKLFRKIAEAAHRCADPGLMFDTTINAWNTVINTGRIRGANPCVEFHFLDDTACNLSSLNLMKFMDRKTHGTNGSRRTTWSFDVTAFRHAVRLFTIAKEIIVDYASYPTREIAQNSHDFRPLGLGYANLGAAIMVQGMPYDSPEAREFAAAVNSVMCGEAYRTSGEIAAHKGPFPGFAFNREPMLNVIANHREAALKIASKRFETLAAAGRLVWDGAFSIGSAAGFRNAQVTVTAPTGTIGFLMDCDTTGIEPDFALVKSKKLAGGGYMTILNQSIVPALETLGYSGVQSSEILDYIEAYQKIEGAPHIAPEHLPVFDCANKCGSGSRFIAPMGHIYMLEAVQPFVSGSISKTVNMPKETTVDEIEHIYMEAWKRGLKCLALYRDQCKESQPLSSGSDKSQEPGAKSKATTDIILGDKRDAGHGPPPSVRHRLSKKRRGITQEFTVGGQKIYLRTGEYGNGALGEVFIDMHKEGAFARSFANCFAILTSLALQHGVPIERLVEAFTFTRFEPAGKVGGHDNVKNATSILDAIFRILAVEYMGEAGLEYAHVKPDRVTSSDTTHDKAAEEQPKPSGTKVTREAVACPRCGALTTRSGTCFTCLSCGTTTGCS